MRAAAIALTLLVASTALADRNRDNDPIVLNEQRVNERLDNLEKLLRRIDDEKNAKKRARLVSDARDELQDLRKMVRRAPELEQRPSVPAPPRPPPGQPTPPPRPAVYPIADAALRDLMRAINHESFPKDRLRVLKQASPAHYFVVDQAQHILKAFDFPRDRLEAVRELKPRLLDRENFFKLYSSFEFSSDKAELKRILEGQ